MTEQNFFEGYIVADPAHHSYITVENNQLVFVDYTGDVEAHLELPDNPNERILTIHRFAEALGYRIEGHIRRRPDTFKEGDRFKERNGQTGTVISGPLHDDINDEQVYVVKLDESGIDTLPADWLTEETEFTAATT